MGYRMEGGLGTIILGGIIGESDVDICRGIWISPDDCDTGMYEGGWTCGKDIQFRVGKEEQRTRRVLLIKVRSAGGEGMLREVGREKDCGTEARGARNNGGAARDERLGINSSKAKRLLICDAFRISKKSSMCV